MPPSPDRPDAGHRRARFVVPPPPGRAGVERLRLVDPTGCAVAWLGYGERLAVLAFFVADQDGTWREVLRDRIVADDPAPPGWTLVERDPTMARLRDGAGTEAIAAIADGVLTIARGDTLLLAAGPDDPPSAS